MAPIVTPISVAMAATVSAIWMSFSTPAMTWANMSLPMALVPNGFVHDGGSFRLLVICGGAELPEVPDQDRGDAQPGEDDQSENGQSLMQEAAENDAELALGLPAGQAVRVLGQLEPRADAGQGVRARLGRGHLLRRLDDEVLPPDRISHSESSGRGRRRGCPPAG